MTRQYIADSLGIYNVKDFGAKGDGTTDDTAAIQAAIDAACTALGGEVWFPPPTSHYKVNGTLHVWSQGVTLKGAGRRSILRFYFDGSEWDSPDGEKVAINFQMGGTALQTSTYATTSNRFGASTSKTVSSGTGTSLTGQATDLSTAGVQKGDLVYNITDGSWAEVISRVDEVLTTTQFVGGADNTATAGDTYFVAGPAMIAQSGIDGLGFDNNSTTDTTAKVCLRLFDIDRCTFKNVFVTVNAAYKWVGLTATNGADTIGIKTIGRQLPRFENVHVRANVPWYFGRRYTRFSATDTTAGSLSMDHFELIQSNAWADEQPNTYPWYGYVCEDGCAIDNSRIVNANIVDGHGIFYKKDTTNETYSQGLVLDDLRWEQSGDAASTNYGVHIEIDGPGSGGALQTCQLRGVTLQPGSGGANSKGFYLEGVQNPVLTSCRWQGTGSARPFLTLVAGLGGVNSLTLLGNEVNATTEMSLTGVSGLKPVVAAFQSGYLVPFHGLYVQSTDPSSIRITPITKADLGTIGDKINVVGKDQGVLAYVTDTDPGIYVATGSAAGASWIRYDSDGDGTPTPITVTPA